MADTEAPVPVLFKKRSSKAAARKRPATTPPPQNDSESSEEYSSADEATGARQIKRRRRGGVAAGSSAPGLRAQQTGELKATEFAASGTEHITDTNDATKSSRWYDESDLSAEALLGKSTHRKSQATQPDASDGTYRGQAAYSSHIQKSQASLERKSTVGPIKAPPSNIRTITVTDFAPDVCKDYKQTGFCGFGDSCKFLHAREDYAQGWQLDKEWEKVNTGKKPASKVVGRADRSLKAGAEDMDDEDDSKLEGIPFACIICKESYKNPIVTKCGHYFCEKCALDRYRKNPNCAACGAGTNGVFNAAKGLKKILDKKRERAAIKEERERETANNDE